MSAPATSSPAIEPGRVGNLTAEQEAALAQLKAELTASGQLDATRHDDHLLLRFLRARKFDVAKAKKMLLDYEAWRRDFGVSTLVATFDFPEAATVHKLYPQYYHGTDKVGRPIYIEHLGGLDLKALMAATSMDRMHMKHVYEYEKLISFRLPACSKKAGRYLEQSCTIIDLKGVSLFAFPQVAGFVKQVSTIAQDYYPEMLGKMYIINAPMLFSSVWNMVKPLLDEVTVNKIHILGSSYKDKLFESIDPSQLPAAIGGTCKCEGGCDKADPGPWADPMYAVQGDWREPYRKAHEAIKAQQGESKPNGAA